MAIRVLRLIEYVYDTPEQATADMARWTHNRIVPGVFSMRSAVIPFEVVPWGVNDEHQDTDTGGA